MGREFLSSHRRRAGEKHGLALSPLSFQQLKNGPVVQVRIVIMHLHRIRSIEPGDVLHRDSFPEIRFEAVHAHVEQGFQLSLIPCGGIRIGKVHQSHSRLPHIRLPHVPVRLFQKIALLHSFLKQRGFLTDIGIDPYADLQPPVAIPLQHTLRVREGRRIPGEITPLEGFHPVAVKMEYMKGNVSVRHSLNEAAGGRFVIISGKRSREPESKGPCRGKRRLSGKLRILLNGSLRRLSVDHIVIQPFPLHGELDSLHLLTCDLKGHVSLVIHQNTIALICYVKGNVFIGNFAGCTAVLVPHLHDLSVFDERGKTFAQSVYGFIHIDGQGFHRIDSAGLVVSDICHVPKPSTGQLPVSVQEADPPGIRTLVHHCFRFSGLIEQKLFVFLNSHMGRRIFDFRKRTPIRRSVKMGDGHLNHILHRTGKADSQHSQIQTVSPVCDMFPRRIDGKLLSVSSAVCVFHGIKRRHFLFYTPVSVCKFHVGILLFPVWSFFCQHIFPGRKPAAFVRLFPIWRIRKSPFRNPRSPSESHSTFPLSS